MSNHEVVIISANPKSGSRSRTSLVAELKQSIEAVGYDCEIYTDLQQMAGSARTLAEEGLLRTVVSAGGDGTASMVASLIPSEIPLTLFPTGSENLLANYYSIAADVKKCVKSIQKLQTKNIDVMLVNGKLSLLMASVGFDAEVVRRVHLSRKSHVSRWTYWCAIFNTLVRYRWPDLKIVIRGENEQKIEETYGSWVFVFNIPRYAAGLNIIPDAKEDDEFLDIGVFDRGGLLHGLCCYWAVVRGKHHQMKQWRRFRCKSIEIDFVAEKPTQSSCQTDGDWGCEMPVTIQIADRKLRLVL